MPCVESKERARIIKLFALLLQPFLKTTEEIFQLVRRIYPIHCAAFQNYLGIKKPTLETPTAYARAF